MIRVVLADDHTILRDKIRSLLAQESDMEVVGQASNGLLLLEVLAQTPTDVVVLDLHMPAMDGLTATKLIRQRFPDVKVLVLSMLDHAYYAAQAFEAGALGYALKNSPLRELLHAIRTVNRSAPFLCTEIGLSLVDSLLCGTSISASLDAQIASLATQAHNKEQLDTQKASSFLTSMPAHQPHRIKSDQ
ncbi:response regulator transcription factor [Hymenobacter sp. GOD-10R]|uniref:response regulator n=1 Tax=Hymenobacter sp. GOD-10R TaxID=3093922 RepID=UPI002D7998F1|nr:response regulator transcription factor [Hymenobacter sp. GOD-10R]WRQ29077.1 response regulator transcription factor [Hymenobacter sp. GOD-10R]